VTPPPSPAADRVPLFGAPLGLSKRAFQGGMEGDDPSRRQYGQSNYPPGYVPDYRDQNITDNPGGNVYNIQNVRGGQTADASGRFRQTHMLGQPRSTSAPMLATGGNPQDPGGYGFQQAQPYQMQGSSLQFQPQYPQEPQRQQQFQTYTSSMAPNVPQQAQPHSPYDAIAQYQPRQSAAIEGLSTQFGVPQYFNPGQATSAPGPASMPQHYASANFPQQVQYPSASLERSVAPQPYQPVMAEYDRPEVAAAPPEVAAAPPEESAQDTGPDARYELYQAEMRALNQNISEGRLSEAGPSLLKLSEWLLGNVVGLGMFMLRRSSPKSDLITGLITDRRDSWGDVYEERLKLWNEFNLLWEALLQRQLENTENMIRLNRSPPPPQSILDKPTLTKMGDELVRWCDSIEQHGLVDYEMGVAEEQIISSESDHGRVSGHYNFEQALTKPSTVLEKCLDILESTEKAPETDVGSAAGPSAQS